MWFIVYYAAAAKLFLVVFTAILVGCYHGIAWWLLVQIIKYVCDYHYGQVHTEAKYGCLASPVFPNTVVFTHISGKALLCEWNQT